MHVLLGICGSIAAYKSPELVRLLSKNGADVTCILTANGARFVTPLTLRSLSKHNVYENMFGPYSCEIEHISLAQSADIIVVAPVTADTMSRLAAGQANDMLSSVILSTLKPVLLCPAMNENMWAHPATVKNIQQLKSYGYHFVMPEKGELACGGSGEGRLADINKILQSITDILKS